MPVKLSVVGGTDVCITDGITDNSADDGVDEGVMM